MVGESCFEGVLCKTSVSLKWFVVICGDSQVAFCSCMISVDHWWTVGLTCCVR